MGIAGTWLVPFEAMRNLMTATAIVSTVVLLWYGWPGFRRALHGMTFFGRMSLTNYLLQSLLGTALFYNWGLGLYRHVDVIYGTLAGVGIILVQYLFCRLWLRRHTHGPVEWVWKKLTWIDLPIFLYIYSRLIGKCSAARLSVPGTRLREVLPTKPRTTAKP